MILALALSATMASSPATCEGLKSLSLPNATITAAEMVAAGPYTPPAFGGAPPAAAGCRRTPWGCAQLRPERRPAGAALPRRR